MKFLLIFLLANTAAIACTPQAIQGPGGNEMKRLEVLHAVNLRQDAIEITVIGTGCTLAEHFDIQATDVNGKCQVSIYRSQSDRCRGMPLPVTLKLPWNSSEVCGSGTIEIQNPLQAAVPSR